MDAKANPLGKRFSVPSFWSGAARILDLGGTFDVSMADAIAEQTDAEALAEDWLVVGDDLREAIASAK